MHSQSEYLPPGLLRQQQLVMPSVSGTGLQAHVRCTREEEVSKRSSVVGFVKHLQVQKKMLMQGSDAEIEILRLKKVAGGVFL